MTFDVIKALHIIFVVSWFAGLFYMVRLFIYDAEANEKSEPEKSILQKQFQIMQSRLWWIITTPAMILSVIFGTWMIFLNATYYLSAPWMHLKLGFVFLLLIYHFWCQLIMKRFKLRIYKWTPNQLRLWNELATLFLVIIVFIVVLKNTMNWIYGTFGFFATGFTLMLGIKAYKSIRQKRNEN
jgi:putative membrane protein